MSARFFNYLKEGNEFKDFYDKRAIHSKNKRIMIPTQANAYNYYVHKENGLKSKEGNFYEELSRAIYGGKLKKRQHNEIGEYFQNIMTIEPDVSSERFDRESKGVHINQALKLRDGQMAKYAYMNFNSKEKRIKFELYLHGVDNLLKNFKNKSLEDLIYSFAQNTHYSISLPMSLMFDIYSKAKKFTKRYVGNSSWGTLTQFYSRGIDGLFLFPEQTIEEMGLDPSQYKIRKTKISNGIKVNGFSVKQFPVLIIEDLDVEKSKNEIEHRVQNFIDLPKGFVREYGRLIRNPKYIENHLGEIEQMPSEVEELNLFTPEKTRDQMLIEAGFGPVLNEESPF